MSTCAKEKRVRKNREYLRVYKKGVKIVKKDFVLYVLNREDNSKTTRLGLSVSKKISKKATDRNRIKRLFRESFRSNERLVENRGFDIVLVSRKGMIGIDFNDIRRNLSCVLRKI